MDRMIEKDAVRRLVLNVVKGIKAEDSACILKN